MKCVFIVRGRSGYYSDEDDWSVCVCESRDDAEKQAERLNGFMLKIEAWFDKHFEWVGGHKPVAHECTVCGETPKGRLHGPRLCRCFSEFYALDKSDRFNVGETRYYVEEVQFLTQVSKS